MSRPVFSDLLEPSTRRNRQSYFLFIIISSFATFVLGAMMEGAGSAASGLALIATLVVMVIGIIVGVQRLHDVDKSGWWMLLMFIPIVNLLLGLYMLFARGTEGPNRFGPDPLARGGLSLRA